MYEDVRKALDALFSILTSNYFILNNNDQQTPFSEEPARP